MLYFAMKNAPAFYNAVAVAVNSKVVGLAPGIKSASGTGYRLFKFYQSAKFFREKRSNGAVANKNPWASPMTF
jgi:hypothetical protein